MRGGKGEETLRVQGPLPPVEEAGADEGDGARMNLVMVYQSLNDDGK